MKQVLTFWKNKITGKVHSSWLTKHQYENITFDFMEKYQQVGGI